MIRQYASGIQIVGDSTYVNDVVSVLDFIHNRSDVGRFFVQEIGRGWTGLSGEIRSVQDRYPVVTIVPDTNNFPVADAVEILDAAARNAVVRERLMGEEIVRGVGTGRGSSVRIPFSPSMMAHGPAIRNRQCTLVHELTHALRMKQGLLNRSPISGNFDDAEEFFAIILVENTFRSGLRWPLRENHHGYHEMDPPRAFYDESDFQALFPRFQTQMGSFAIMLANLDSCQYPYNPYREFVNSPAGMGW